MTPISATLLFAALASAQSSNYTTTAWMTKFAGSDKFGYVASVIDADAQQMTLSMDFSAETDPELLLGSPVANHTFGPSGFTINEALTRFMPMPSGDINVKLACTQPAQSAENVTCTGVWGEGFARFIGCNEDLATRTEDREASTTTLSYPLTYGSGIWGEGGTETVVRTITFPAASEITTAAWCTSDKVPESELTYSYTTTAAEFAVYEIVIYAGQEKLSAYQSGETTRSASGSTNVTAPTASAGGSGSAAPSATTRAPAENTGAAGRINAVVPALAGMGVAAMMGLL